MASPLKLRYTPGWAFLAAASVVLLIVVTYIATGLEGAAKRRIAELIRSNSATRRSNSEMADFTAEALSKARAQADMFRATLLNDTRIAAFKQSQQTFWSVVEKHSEQTQEYKKVRMELTRASAPMSDWPQIVDTVQSLQGCPGMTVRQVTISTSGDSNQRIFDHVTLGVTLFVRLNDN